jgi:hypothetical protein
MIVQWNISSYNIVITKLLPMLPYTLIVQLQTSGGLEQQNLHIFGACYNKRVYNREGN